MVTQTDPPLAPLLLCELQNEADSPSEEMATDVIRAIRDSNKVKALTLWLFDRQQLFLVDLNPFSLNPESQLGDIS